MNGKLEGALATKAPNVDVDEDVDVDVDVT